MAAPQWRPLPPFGKYHGRVQLASALSGVLFFGGAFIYGLSDAAGAAMLGAGAAGALITAVLRPVVDELIHEVSDRIAEERSRPPG
jgi:hypothetical protein